MCLIKKTVMITILLVALSCLMSVTSFAAISPTSVVDQNTFVFDPERGADPNHGFVFSTNQSYTKLLNQYTSAKVTPPGTYLTTWENTGHSSQGWVKKISGDGKFAFVCASNETVAININRSNYSRANVYTLVGNYYGDVALDTGNSTATISISVSSRGNYPEAHLRESSVAAPGSNGKGYYCEWSTTAKTLFVEGDWGPTRATKRIINR